MEMEKNLEVEQETTLSEGTEWIDFLQMAYTSMFHNVDREAALKEFRSIVNAEDDDTELDEIFNELLDALISEEHIIEKAVGGFKKLGVTFEDLEGVYGELAKEN
jgi:hypothetical protein